MNPKMLRKYLLIALSLILFTSVSNGNGLDEKSEKKVYKGYIITMLGDTINGKIRMLSPTMNQVKVKFIGKDDEKVTYKSKDIASYAFLVKEWDKEKKQNVNKWIFYTKKTVERPPIPFSSTEVLIQQEEKGNICLYNYYIETRTNQNIEHLVYVEKDGVLYEVNKGNYKKVLKKLTKDLALINVKIGKKGYSYRNIDTTIESYNKLILDVEEPTVNNTEIGD